MIPAQSEVLEENIIRISSKGTSFTKSTKEMFAARELLFFLVWRDIKIRYKQTVLGFSWAIFQPLITMAIFSVFLGRLAKVPSSGFPYPVFCLAALVPWTLFSNSVMMSANSLVSSANMLKKIYFPRVFIPVASVLAGSIDFCISFLLLLAVSFIYGFTPGITILLMPIFLLFTLACAIGVGLWLSTLSVEYRDIKFVVPYLTQIWLFATPVTYSAQMLSEKWKWIYALNPMVGIVEGFRWSVLGGELDRALFLPSIAVTLCLIISGFILFRYFENRFPDTV